MDAYFWDPLWRELGSPGFTLWVIVLLGVGRGWGQVIDSSTSHRFAQDS